MNQRSEYNAPWAMSLKIMTIAVSTILIGIPTAVLIDNSHKEEFMFAVSVLLPLAILLIAAIFMIRGYKLKNGKLTILRLGWASELNLNNLKKIDIDPKAMKGSIRTFGNGGLFSFSGKYWNRRLGSFRALATDPKLSVVLTFIDKVVVVTPDDPGGFVKNIENLTQ